MDFVVFESSFPGIRDQHLNMACNRFKSHRVYIRVWIIKIKVMINLMMIKELFYNEFVILVKGFAVNISQTKSRKQNLVNKFSHNKISHNNISHIKSTTIRVQCIHKNDVNNTLPLIQ